MGSGAWPHVLICNQSLIRRCSYATDRKRSSFARHTSDRHDALEEDSMDSKQFDALSRSLARGVSRRRAVTRLGAGGVVAGLAALTGRSEAGALPALQSDTCRLSVVATVRVGPSAGTLFQSNVPGQLRGEVSFSIGQGG